jgi:zinc transport system substrate-binding protein
MKSKYLFLLPFTLFLLAVTSNISLGSENKLKVVTVNYPLAYFAERIAGDFIDIGFPAPPDEDPAYWMPEKTVVSLYQNADLILLNGAGYAKWTAKVSLPASRTVKTSKSVMNRYIYTKEAVTHSHGPKGEHAHENLAFTTWLDFSIAAAQARATANALGRKLPARQDTIKQNFEALEQELLALDRQIAELALSQPGLPLVGSHPVYDYLAQRYGLNLKSVHWEPHEVPGNAQLAELKALLKDHPAKWMVWEGIPKQESVQALARIGVKSIVFSPCSNRPENGDFMTVMAGNIENMKQIYQ